MDSDSAQTTSRADSLSDAEVAYNLLRTYERIGILNVEIPDMPKSLDITQSSQSTLHQSVDRRTIDSLALSSASPGARPLTPSLGTVRSGESTKQGMSLFDSFDVGSVGDEAEALNGAMPKRYQRAAAAIWQVAKGEVLSDEALLEGKLSEIFRGAMLKKSVLRLADREDLRTFISIYRTTLIRCFTPNCKNEINLKGKARRGMERTRDLEDPRTATNDLQNAYQTISRFHCWFQPRVKCDGEFGSCPYKPEKLQGFEARHLQLLQNIREAAVDHTRSCSSTECASLLLLRHGVRRRNFNRAIQPVECVGPGN